MELRPLIFLLLTACGGSPPGPGLSAPGPGVYLAPSGATFQVDAQARVLDVASGIFLDFAPPVAHTLSGHASYTTTTLLLEVP